MWRERERARERERERDLTKKAWRIATSNKRRGAAPVPCRPCPSPSDQRPRRAPSRRPEASGAEQKECNMEGNLGMNVGIRGKICEKEMQFSYKLQKDMRGPWACSRTKISRKAGRTLPSGIATKKQEQKQMERGLLGCAEKRCLRPGNTGLFCGQLAGVGGAVDCLSMKTGLTGLTGRQRRETAVKRCRDPGRAEVPQVVPNLHEAVQELRRPPQNAATSNMSSDTLVRMPVF